MAVDTQTINSLLASRNISKVVYVDDSFAPSSYEPNFKAFVRANCGKEHGEWPFDDTGIEEVTIGNFSKWWNSLEDTDKETQAELFHIDRDQNEVERKIRQYFTPEILTCLSPDSFNHFYIDGNSFSPSEGSQLLILMDYQLDNGQDGLELLRKFDNNQFVSCGIFSQNLKIEDEIDRWASWCNYASHIYPISKDRALADNSVDFLQGLRNIIWLRQISDIKVTYIRLLTSALERVKVNFSHIDPASFDKVVMEESEVEGCWEFETIHRIGEAYLNKTIEDALISSTFETFQNQTNILRIIKDASGQQLPDNTLIAEEITSYEKYTYANFLNKTFCPIGNGDIFQLEDKYYILLCQPCNLEIRKNGKRKAGSLLYLLPIEPFDDKMPFIERIRFQSKDYMIRYSCASLNSADIIDLVSFNCEGEAVLPIESDSVDGNVLIRPNMKARYRIIREHIMSFYNAYSAISKTPIKESLDDQICMSIVDALINPKSKGELFPTPSIDEGSIHFGLKRIARLKDPFAQECLQVFMSYLCRPANPMELK